MPDTWVYTLFGDTTTVLEEQVVDLIARGAIIRTLSIAYGAPPNGSAYNTWIAMVTGEWQNGAPDA